MNDALPEIIDDPELNISDNEEYDENEISSQMIDIREPVDTEDVFDRRKKSDPAPTSVTIKPVKKEKKPRKPMSEEHKQKLKFAREKAIIARQIKAVENKKMKELESKVSVKKKEKKIKEMEDIVNDVPEPKQKVDIDESIIQNAIAEALEKNEIMRQRRKQAKKATQNEAIEKAKAQEMIRQAVYPPKAYFGDAGFASKHIYNFQ